MLRAWMNDDLMLRCCVPDADDHCYCCRCDVLRLRLYSLSSCYLSRIVLYCLHLIEFYWILFYVSYICRNFTGSSYWGSTPLFFLCCGYFLCHKRFIQEDLADLMERQVRVFNSCVVESFLDIYYRVIHFSKRCPL